MKNPFHFGTLVSGASFYDRAEKERELLRAVENGANVLLYGPRRYGKSSLVARVLEKLRASGHPCIYFDMMKVDSVDAFLQAYASAVLDLRGSASKSLESLSKFFRGLRPRFSVGDDGKPTVELDFSDPPTTRTLEDVLSLPEKAAENGKKIVVVFDEFQEIARLSAHLPLERIFRSVIQRQKRVNYIYLGSKTHIIRRMFTEEARPFYQSAIPMLLEKPPQEESLAFLRDRFANCGIEVEDAALAAIVERSENIPYYLQALAYEVFESADATGRKSVSPADVADALEIAERRSADTFENIVENLSETQRTLLTALANEPAAAFDAAYRRRHRMPNYATIASALKVLVEKGLVESGRKSHRVANPFLAAWLREPPCTASVPHSTADTE